MAVSKDEVYNKMYTKLPEFLELLEQEIDKKILAGNFYERIVIKGSFNFPPGIDSARYIEKKFEERVAPKYVKKGWHNIYI